MMPSYMTSFSRCADLLIEKLIRLQADDTREFNLLPHLEHSAVQAVCSTLFGMDLMDKKIDEIYVKTTKIFESYVKKLA